MKKFIIVLFLFPVVTFCQKNIDSVRYTANILSDAYRVQPALLRNYIYAGVPDNLKKGIFEKMSYVFSCQASYEISKIIGSGDIYSNWPGFETYLNEVLQKIMPAELQQDTMIHAYIVQDGSYNAFMTPTGHMFVNIGLFSHIPDEATLAAVFTHELAHYYFKHSLLTYIADQTGKFDLGLLGTPEKVYNHYSIKFELQADSMGMRWLQRTNYKLLGMMNAFEIGERLENNMLSLSETDFKIDENDHPTSGMRYNRLLNYYNKFKDKPGEFFLVSEQKFNKYKEEAKPEILRCLLDNYQYYACIENAFKFHIFDPNNSVYIHYLVDAIRRKCYMDINLWKENFITNRYYDTLLVNNIMTKKKMQRNLFESFNTQILPMSAQDAQNVKAKYYWNGDAKFKTYEEAFEFYFRLSQAFKDHECMLLDALSYSDDKASQNLLLQRYLNYNDIDHREFAETLLKDTLIQKLSTKKLIVLNRFETVVRLGQEDIPVPSFTSETPAYLKSILDSVVSGNANYKPLYLPSLKETNMSDYKLFCALEELSYTIQISKGQRAYAYILNPDYWDLFRKYDVKEIEFLNCFYFDDRKSEKLIDAFKNATDSDFKSIFSSPYNNDYLEVFISSFRVTAEKISKYVYDAGSIKLDGKGTAYEKIIAEIKNQMTKKEKEARQYYNYMSGIK
ncbi:MAG: M48 family metallopeptidase [Bacteroidota bacterium]